MSDERLRQLEREAASGDVDAKAKLLLERMRIGGLTAERLRLAAYLGDEASRRALGTEAPPEVHELGQMIFLLCAKNPDPRACGVRSLIRTALFHEERDQDDLALHSQGSVVRLMHRLEAWCLNPGSKTRRGIGRSLHTLNNKRELRLTAGSHQTHLDLAAKAVQAAANLVLTGSLEDIPRIASRGILESSGTTQPHNQDNSRPYWAEAPDLREAICADLVPWALGERDAVRERAEARGHR